MEQDNDPYSPPDALLTEQQPKDKGSILAGVGYCLLGLALIALLAGFFFPMLFLFFGAVLMLIAIPMAFTFKKKGQTATVQGILITAGIAFLLNAACFGLMFFTSIH